VIYDYDSTERRVAAGALSRHDGDLLHGYAVWLRMDPAARPPQPTEGDLLALGERRREGPGDTVARIRALVDVPPSSSRELLERGDNRHAAWRLVYAARGDDYPGTPQPGDDRLEALVEVLWRDGWHR
jgi:hypothetical protein